MYVGADSDAIRLVSMEDNGFNSQNGIVQVMQKFSWSFINGSDWNLPNAIVACRNLGELVRFCINVHQFPVLFYTFYTIL